MNCIKTYTKYPFTGKISEAQNSSSYEILTTNSLTRGLSLTATKSISIRLPKERTIKGTEKNVYYWLLNQSVTGDEGESVFRLFDEAPVGEVQRYQFKLDEFLMVCSEDMSIINVYGSGTVITRYAESGTTLTKMPAWEVKDIGEIDLNDLEKIRQATTSLENSLSIDLKEMQFVVLSKGAEIYTENSEIDINGEAKSIGGPGSKICYKSSASDPNWTEIIQKDLDSEALENLDGWSIYSALNINISPETPQALLNGHKFILENTDGDTYSYDGNTENPVYLQASSSIALFGGTHLNVSTTDVYTEKTEYPEFVGYTQPDLSEQDITITNNFDCVIEFNHDDASGGRIEKQFNFSTPEGEYIIPLVINSSNINDLKLILNSTGASIQLLNSIPDSSYSNSIYITSPQSGTWYYIKLTVTEVQSSGINLNVSILDPGSGKKKITFGAISQRVAREYSTYNGDFESAVISRIQALDTDGIFDYSYAIPEEDYIKDPLDPLSFLNSKHIFNKFTICKLTPTTKKYMDNTTGDITVTNKIK